jgi:hypothetical protein
LEARRRRTDDGGSRRLGALTLQCKLPVLVPVPVVVVTVNSSTVSVLLEPVAVTMVLGRVGRLGTSAVLLVTVPVLVLVVL